VVVAEVAIRGDELVVRLSTTEKLESLHSEVSVPLSAVRSVEVVENALDHVHGIRVGTGIPGSTAVGTFTSKTAKIFGVIHHGEHRGIRILLEGADFDEILLGCADPESVASTIPVTS
jgi:hypothetical protein